MSYKYIEIFFFIDLWFLYCDLMVINFNMIVLVFMILNLGFCLVKFLIIDVNSFIYMELVLRIVELNVFMEVCLMV